MHLHGISLSAMREFSGGTNQACACSGAPPEKCRLLMYARIAAARKTLLDQEFLHRCRPQIAMVSTDDLGFASAFHNIQNRNEGCMSFYRTGIFIPFLTAAVVLAAAASGIAPSRAQPAPAAPTAVGLWEQVDDVTGKPESWFKITEKNGVFEGVLVKGFGKPGDDPAEWRCEKCEGAEKGAPVVGLTLIKNMARSGLKYENGTIMDPRDGSVYRSLMELSPDGQKLTVRGYLGIALFGRSQVWNRLPDNAMDPAAATPRRPAAPAAKQPPAKK
jgi:uncharacterized protein (DUF2147 family)